MEKKTIYINDYQFFIPGREWEKENHMKRDVQIAATNAVCMYIGSAVT